MKLYEFLLFGIFLLIMIFTHSNVTAMGTERTLRPYTELPITIHNDINIGLKEIQGLDEVKGEIKEYINFHVNKDKYTKMGISLPKGIMFVGPPGCGKTLLAKAIAGETNSTFIVVDSTRFNEMYVGVGSSRMDKVFKAARQHRPAILFFDEIDSIGCSRTFNSNSSEQNNLLNKLLIEMDGFEDNEDIMVFAATNRFDSLDSALTRSGRFDRKIVIDPPNANERKDMFNFYIKNMIVDNNVNTEHLASITPGFTGADIKNIVNQSGIIAIRMGQDKINMGHMIEAIDEHAIGARKKNQLMTDKELEIVAYHEAGHAYLGYVLKGVEAPIKVSIVPRTGGVLGYAQPNPVEKNLHSYQEMCNQISVLLGGRIVEEIFFGGENITTGASDDIEKATELVYKMHTRFGFDKKLGCRNFNLEKTTSEQKHGEIDCIASDFITQIYKKTYDMLINSKNIINRIAKELLENKDITYENIKAISGPSAENSIEIIEFLTN